MKASFRTQVWHGWSGCGVLALGSLALAICWPAPAAAGPPDAEELFTPFVVAQRVMPPTDQAPPARPEQPRDPSSPADYKQLVRAAVVLIKQGQYQSAIALLEPYRANDDFLTLHALGVGYVRTGRNQEAYDVLLRAHRLSPTVAAPLLPAALACARIAKRCDDYRSLALEYKALGGKFTRLADKIANHLPFTLTFTTRS